MHSRKFAVPGGDDLHNENTVQEMSFKAVLGTSFIAMDKAIQIKVNILFIQITVSWQVLFFHLDNLGQRQWHGNVRRGFYVCKS